MTDYHSHQATIPVNVPAVPTLEPVGNGEYRCGHCGAVARRYGEGEEGFYCFKCWSPNQLPTDQKELF